MHIPLFLKSLFTLFWGPITILHYLIPLLHKRMVLTTFAIFLSFPLTSFLFLIKMYPRNDNFRSFSCFLKL